jgi:hypothetical protein
MEFTNSANEFVGSPIFITLVIIAVIAIAFLLRMTFQSSNSEYKHKSDE